MSVNSSPVYFKLPDDLSQDFNVYCKATGYTKTGFLTSRIFEVVQDYKKENPKIFDTPRKKIKQSSTKSLDRWLVDLTRE